MAFQDLTLDSILAKGRRCVVDYRYKSVLPNTVRGEDIRIGKAPFFNLENELAHIGSACWRSIPEDVRLDRVYTIDAVIDSQGRLWVLEANSNPFVHPYVYRAMIKSWLDRVGLK